VTRLVLDAGALVALERGDARLGLRIDEALLAGHTLLTHPLVLAQVWRGGGGRQARLARALRAVEVVPLDEDGGKRVGELLGYAGTSDAVDAAVVDLAEEDDVILTSDPGDLTALVTASGRAVRVVPC
jgi:hypothetical protein